MAADQERADRIRQLKADHPEIRWRMVAEHVGVTERAAQEWQKTGGIEPENAKKLASLFDVTYEWLWFGRDFGTDDRGPTPDLLGSVDRVDGHIDRMADEFRGYVDELKTMLNDARVEREILSERQYNIAQLLASQEKILQSLTDTVLEMQRVAAGFPDDDALNAWREGARNVLASAEALEAVRASSEEAPAGTPRRRASNG